MDNNAHHNTTRHSDVEIIDHDQFEDMRDLLEEDFVDLIEVFITDSRQRIEKLREAQHANDNANGFETAHALKGASANIGATQLLVLSGELQELCRAGEVTQQADLIDDIAHALERTEQEIYQRLGQS